MGMRLRRKRVWKVESVILSAYVWNTKTTDISKSIYNKIMVVYNKFVLICTNDGCAICKMITLFSSYDSFTLEPIRLVRKLVTYFPISTN